jgi:hypothetical protein
MISLGATRSLIPSMRTSSIVDTSEGDTKTP